MNYKLINNNDNLILKYNNNNYYLTSQPYEPCLYVSLDNKIILIIHNSYNINELIDNNKLKSITGKEYDVNTLCEMIIYGIDNHLYDIDIGYLEKEYNINNISELKDDIFYKEYKKYPECVIDYCIIKYNKPYDDINSHMECILYALDRFGKKDNIYYKCDKSLMKGSKIDSSYIFDNNKSYYHLLLNPPHGCSYTINDFNKINNLLFPKGYDNLEIYKWNTNFSNYFDEGREWWGTLCLSIYDKSMDRFIIIGASSTD